MSRKPRGAASSLPRFAAADCLIQPIRQSIEGTDPVLLKVPDHGHVWIDPVRKLFKSHIRSEEGFFTARPEALIMQADSASPDGGARALDELLYRAGWFASDSALIDECHPYDIIEMRQWPNFTRLPHAQSLFALASLLARRPSSMSIAYRKLRVPQTEALRFFNAVVAAGYVRVVSSQPDSVSAPASKDAVEAPAAGGFWSRLFERMSGL